MNAVTVWMLMAHGIESRITGLIHFGGGSPLRSAFRLTLAMSAFSRK